MSNKDFQITVVVNGKPEVIKVDLDEPIAEAVDTALDQSGNSGQPAEQWELRDETGQVLDLGKTVRELDIKEGAKLFLNLTAGVGGSCV
ncbi:DUF2604 domain-containing protein [Candidatus Palauibacter sp.]|uniref:DUF2604 domain-containing protein n=1 Tax=Candidatus Palauibacter sp. TaxID=3101350 RepID=UPI003D0ACE8A